MNVKSRQLFNGKRLVLGCGTGRCGTTSLAKLFSLQPNTFASHELFDSRQFDFNLSYKYRPKNLEKAMQFLSKCPEEIITDCAYYWLNHVIPVLEDYKPDTKFICLTRNKEDVVESFFTQNDGQPFKSPLNIGGLRLKVKGFAVGGIVLPANDTSDETIAILKDGVGNTWDYYKKESERLETKYPDNFKIFPMEALNEKAGVKEILDFAEFPKETQVVEVGIWLNKRRALLDGR